MRRDEGIPVEKAVRLDQELDEHRRMIRHAAARVGRRIDVQNRREIQRVGHVADVECQGPFGHPRERRRPARSYLLEDFQQGRSVAPAPETDAMKAAPAKSEELFSPATSADLRLGTGAGHGMPR